MNANHRAHRHGSVRDTKSPPGRNRQYTLLRCCQLFRVFVGRDCEASSIRAVGCGWNYECATLIYAVLWVKQLGLDCLGKIKTNLTGRWSPTFWRRHKRFRSPVSIRSWDRSCTHRGIRWGCLTAFSLIVDPRMMARLLMARLLLVITQHSSLRQR